MALVLSHIILATLTSLTQGLPARNVTIEVPDGFSTHGKKNLFCVPTKWYHILIFFAVNYVSHAATVKPRPGQSQLHTARDVILALLFPYSGLQRALETIMRSSSFSRDDLTRAARANALCVVVRTPQWRSSSFHRTLTSLSKQDSAETSDESSDHQSSTSLLTDAAPNSNQQNAEPADTAQPQRRSSSLSTKPNRDTTSQSDGLRVKDPDDMESSTRDDVTRDKDGVKSGLAKAFSDVHSFFKAIPDRIHDFVRKGDMNYREINGVCRLPKGYALSFLPSNAGVVSDASDKAIDHVVSSSKSIPRAIIAIVQTFYGSFTLYRARGDQVERFGYAAFSLTVVPYVVMSIMNLVGAILMPDYQAMQVVRSYELDEAITLGAQVDGAVGRAVQNQNESKTAQTDAVDHSKSNPVVESQENGNTEEFAGKRSVSTELRTIHHIKPLPVGTSPDHSLYTAYRLRGRERWSSRTIWVVSFLIVPIVFSAIHIGTIAGMTHFQNGKSTRPQRVWTMLWLVFNAILGPLLEVLSDSGIGGDGDRFDYSQWVARNWRQFSVLLFLIVYGVTAIGGLTMVGQTIHSYGSCTYMMGF